MVSGTLALKNGYYYAVLSYQDAAGKRHQKWVSTGLPQKGNKRRAEQELIRIRSEFEIPPAAGELNSNMLFADYLDQWLEVVRARIKPSTFGSYQGMVKSTIGPYFRKKELTLKELEARHIQQFYTEKLKTVTPNAFCIVFTLQSRSPNSAWSCSMLSIVSDASDILRLS